MQKTNYEYNYSHGKKVFAKETLTVLNSRKIAFSDITTITYIYNAKGLCLQEISTGEGKTNTMTTFYTYDSYDSIANIIELDNKDTIFIEKFANFPDGKKLIFHKHILPDFKNNDNDKSKNLKDTTLYSQIFQYDNKLCKSMQQYDKYGKLKTSIEFVYQNNRLIKEINYDCFQNLKYVSSIKYLDYSKNKKLPDFYIVGNRNDTISCEINEFKQNKLVKSTHLFDSGKLLQKSTFNNQGRLIEDIVKNSSNHTTHYQFKTYFENGEIKEDRSYTDK